MGNHERGKTEKGRFEMWERNLGREGRSKRGLGEALGSSERAPDRRATGAVERWKERAQEGVLVREAAGGELRPLRAAAGCGLLGRAAGDGLCAKPHAWAQIEEWWRGATCVDPVPRPGI